MLLIAGLLVRPSAFVLAITMVVAILTVHLQNGLFMDKGGFEFGLALLAGSVSLMFSGAGRLSVDDWLAKRIAG